ncbi:MAG: hypothetical protein ACI9C0_000260 [Alteromonadaceae bacterium]|jgi:hypothetical protein|tara:strand:- start:550 stop:1422 length:873 start_codon:yes stop_codon:yes gene_type:complete
MKNSASNENVSKPSSWLLISIIIVVILGLSLWFYSDSQQELPVVVEKEAVEEVVEVAAIIPAEVIPEIQVVVERPAIELVEVSPLPSLNESDSWLKEKLPSLTWRKELLKLVVDDNMIRRIVVFTDNFSKGTVTYKHSPLVLPNSSFSAIETQSFDDNNQQEWLWDNSSERRFSLYIDLIKSTDIESLISWYLEIKPLIDEAYDELGYPDDNFTDTLQTAIIRILDAELPKSPLKIIRPSVMYKYQDSAIEALDDVDKLLLRLGKENLLIIKSTLLEFSEKLAEKTSMNE